MILDKGWLFKGIFSVGNNLLNIFMRFIIFFILVRTLSKEQFGIWAIFLVVTSFIEVIRDGFIRNALVKFIASLDSKQTRPIQTASLLLNVVITISSLIFILLISEYLAKMWKAEELIPMFKLYTATSFILIFVSHIEFVAAAFLKFKQIFWINLSRNLTFLAILSTNLLFSIEFDLTNLVIYQSVATLTGLIFGILLLRPIIQFGIIVSRCWLSKLFHFGKYVFGTNLGSMVYSSADQVILGAILSTQSVAIYNTAIRVNNFIDAPVLGISNLFYPQLSHKGPSAFKEIYLRSVGIILGLLLPLLLAIYFLSDFIILLIAGSAYSESAVILRVTILYTLIMPFARQFGSLLDAVGKPQVNLSFTAVSSIVNIGATYFGIKQFGVIGAAYGTLFTHFFGFLVMQFYLHKTYNIKMQDVLNSFMEFYALSFKTTMKFIRNRIK